MVLYLKLKTIYRILLSSWMLILENLINIKD